MAFTQDPRGPPKPYKAKKPKKIKEKKPPNLNPQYYLSKEELAIREAPNKKKKRDGPNLKQPRWLHPDDEENPVLNPKIKPEEQIKKEQEEHDDSINFLQHKVVGAPLKPAPPGFLISLVGGFLTSYGFDSASRLYTSQMSARKRLGDWEVEIGHKLPKKFPTLLWIYKEFEKKWNEEHEDDTSSSESDTSEEDSDSEDAKPTKSKPKAKKGKKKPTASDSDPSDSDSSSEEDSDKFKRSTDITSASKSSSSSDSDSEANAKAKPAVTSKPTPATTQDSDSDDSSSDSDAEPAFNQVALNPVSKPPNSDSSVTLEGAPGTVPNTSDKAQMSESVSSSSSSDDPSSDLDSDVPAPKPAGAMIPPPALLSYDNQSSVPDPQDQSKKRKASPSIEASETSKKPKQNYERWQRVPTDTKVDPKFSSNKYQSYDYAEKAHQDLVVTKGRGFTKEKNKKKKGAYRGGTIDVGGGKGVRFD